MGQSGNPLSARGGQALYGRGGAGSARRDSLCGFLDRNLLERRDCAPLAIEAIPHDVTGLCGDHDLMFAGIDDLLWQQADEEKQGLRGKAHEFLRSVVAKPPRVPPALADRKFPDIGATSRDGVW